MNLTKAVGRGLHSQHRLIITWICALLTMACGEPTDAGDPRGSVCPDCPAVAGGESSDFGGTPSSCSLFESRVPIDAAQAQALGFDVAELERLVQREVDAPFRWRTDPSGNGGEKPPQGYDPDTRIQLRATVVSYTHIELDPSSCTGTVCRDATSGVERPCPDRLELAVTAELRTMDGAINASLTGYVLQGRPGVAFAEPGGSLLANLRDVTGTLRLFPDKDFGIRSGWLNVDVYPRADHTQGDLRTSIYLRSSPGAYMPLSGSWGREPPSPSGVGGAGVLPRE